MVINMYAVYISVIDASISAEPIVWQHLATENRLLYYRNFQLRPQHRCKNPKCFT